MDPTFEWDEQKNRADQRKHGVAFEEAQMAILDPKRVIIRDAEHSDLEERYFLLGRTERGILPVRFTWRDRKIRIIGAGYWRKGRRCYEQENRSSQVYGRTAGTWRARGRLPTAAGRSGLAQSRG